MLAKRIIPCLDIKDSRTVKGVNFVDLIDAGDPVELAKIYSKIGADELVFLDITATKEDRRTFAKLVKEIAKNINIPFTVGGGIKSLEDVDILLKSGADKVSINSYAVKNPDFINELASKFGCQCVVVAIDAKFEDNDWYVYLVGGRVKTEIKLFDWAKEVENRGAGEILFTSMDHDGTKNGFSNKALSKLSNMVNIPVIASGGVGNLDHLVDGIKLGNASAVLAASIFHYGKHSVKEAKEYLDSKGIPVRI